MAGAKAGERPELQAPACSGALALRRITALLTSARRADAQGEYSQARELYLEVLKVQRTLSRAPLGSIGKSLREVVVGVEARLQQLQPALRKIDSTTYSSSSRPSTHCGTSASSESGPTAAGHHRQEDLPPPHPSGGGGGSWSSRRLNELQAEQAAAARDVSWDTTCIPECPASARDGYGGRPTTRDGGGGAGMRPCTEGVRPATSDGRQAHNGLASLDGTRPSTRDDMRIHKQLVDGNRQSARDRKNGSRDAITTPRRPSRENKHPSGDEQRPATSALIVARDSARPPTREDRRCQDVTIRRVTGRRNHTKQQASEVLNLEAFPCSAERSSSPLQSPESQTDALGDESVELLE